LGLVESRRGLFPCPGQDFGCLAVGRLDPVGGSSIGLGDAQADALLGVAQQALSRLLGRGQDRCDTVGSRRGGSATHRLAPHHRAPLHRLAPRLTVA
jgi:hypothetical protein